MTMLRRYSRAARLTAPKVAAEATGAAVEGYWLDPTRYYFLAERVEPSMGRVVSIPSIANAETNSVQEVVSLEALADLLSEYGGQPIDLEALSSAEFDMSDRDTLAVSIKGQDYLVDPRERRVIRAEASLDVPALYSPDGRYACFVKGYDLWLKEQGTQATRPLTNDGAAYHCYGQRSQTGLAAVSYGKRPSPMGLWSADSQWFLTHRIDERSLPDLALIQHAPPGGGRPILHTYKYPMPGDPLPVATYVAVHVASGRVVTFDSFPTPVVAAYAPFSRTVWFDRPHRAWLLRFDRYFKKIDLISLDLAAGEGRIVLSESTTSGCIDLHPVMGLTPNVRTLGESEEIIWYSERSGWGHLYLYDGVTGKLQHQITSGEWLVRDIVHVDELERKLLFLAGGFDPDADPVRRSLCSVNLDGSGFQLLLEHQGDIHVPVTAPCGLGQDHPFRPSNARAGISPDGRFGIVRYASVDRGNHTRIVDLRTRHAFEIASTQPAANEVLPRHFTALAADGETCLHGVMFLPSDFDDRRSYPLVDCIYPGPQATHQPQSFRSMNSAQARTLAELGFATIMLDTRRMPIGARALQQIGYGALLEPQLADHVAVVRQLCKQYSFIDSARVGMMGASGGGAATARALCDYGEIFKVGVAVCGNHDSTFYTAVWSDKYRGPGNPGAWLEQANNSVVGNLKGKLLLISGDMDENVHLSHTLSLADALIRASKDFDLLIVPNEGHGVLTNSGYAQRRVWDYFVQNLLGETPPPDFEITFEPHELARVASNAMQEFQ